jgi:hypothetical protein
MRDGWWKEALGGDPWPKFGEETFFCSRDSDQNLDGADSTMVSNQLQQWGLL